MKRFSLIHLFLLAILALLFAHSPADAAKQVATVVAARGDVQALDAKGKGRPLAVQAPIYEDDTLKTGERSRVQIMFTDNTLISLGNATTMKIAEYQWQPDQKDGALKTQIKEGTFRVMGGALTKTAPQNFKTETPTATIGIRGSMYAGVATADFLSVVFQGGKGIEITNPFGTVEISKPGYGTKVALDKPPLPPMKFTAQELGELNKALGGNGAEEKKEKKDDKETKKEGGATKEEKADKKEEKKGEEKGAAPKEKQAATTTTTTESTATTETAAATTSETIATTTTGTTAEAPTTTTTTAVGEGGTPTTATTTATTTTVTETPTLSSWGTTTTIDPVMETTPLLATTALATNLLVPLVPTDLTTDVVADASQDTLITNVSSTAVATTFTGTGKYGAFRRDIDPSPPPIASFLDWESGSFTTSLFGSGVFEGTLIDDGSSGANNIPNFPIPLGPYTVSASGSSFNVPVSYTDPDGGLITMTATTYVASLGEFFYTTLYHTIDLSPADDILIGFLGYAGTPSSSIPSAGIDNYTGGIVYNNTSATSYNADKESASIEVNYYNRRLIGRSNDSFYTAGHGGAAFFGTVNSDGTANLIVLADGDPVGAPHYFTAANGTVTATFYGSTNQGLGFTASGSDYSLADNSAQHNWQATGAAIRSEATEYITSYPTGSIQYTGYLVGVGDDISTGKVSRIFVNNSPTLSMTVNPTTGVVSGFFSANELTGGTPLSNITIGDPTDLTKSAYVLNDQMVAILSDSDAAYTLKSYGNFLVTAGPDKEITNTSTEYLTWGSWELAYDDPVGGSDDHIFDSQSFFVAGQVTDPGYVTDNLLNRNLTGTYDGKAYGVKIAGPDINNLDATELTNGATHLLISFQNPANANAITGTISFSEATLAINSAASALTSSGFTASVSSVTVPGPSSSTPYSSQVNGAFYGPTATAVGGNFQVQMTNTANSDRYLGVFGGSGTIQ